MIIYVEKKNTNCRKLPINYSKIINDHSCIFMIILLVATLCKSGRAERMLKKRKAACGISISLKK